MTAYYLTPLFDTDKLNDMVRAIGGTINIDFKAKKFDAIVVTGVSGLILGGAISYKFNIPLIVVRKGESCHSSNTIEGDTNCKNVALVDDLIATGSTLKRVRKELKDFNIQVTHAYLFASSADDKFYKQWELEIKSWYYD